MAVGLWCEKTLQGDRGRAAFSDTVVNSPTGRSGIEGFWGLAKVQLAKFKGLPRHTFHLHLKETEWRYNHRHADKYKTLLRYLRQNPIG